MTLVLLLLRKPILFLGWLIGWLFFCDTFAKFLNAFVYCLVATYWSSLSLTIECQMPYHDALLVHSIECVESFKLGIFSFKKLKLTNILSYLMEFNHEVFTTAGTQALSWQELSGHPKEMVHMFIRKFLLISNVDESLNSFHLLVPSHLQESHWTNSHPLSCGGSLSIEKLLSKPPLSLIFFRLSTPMFYGLMLSQKTSNFL